MKDRSVSSYDLKQAQQILKNLAPSSGAEIRDEKGSIAAAEYVRLSLEAPPRTPAVQVDTTAAPPPETHAPEEIAPQRFSSWENCISWCMSLTRSEAAFVVDSQGFIIASRGRVPGHGFEGTGAELICSVEQLERVDPDAGKLLWVDLDFDKRRVVGFVTPAQNADYYVLGLISPDRSYYTHKQALTRQIVDNLPNLD
jgi:hypothetical protein